jgi:hypothetical protein
MKTFYFCERKNRQMGRITCNGCNAHLGDEGWYEQTTSKQFEGMNYGEHICSGCRNARNKAYDSYIMQRDMFGRE